MDPRYCFKEDFTNWLKKSNHPFFSTKYSDAKGSNPDPTLAWQIYNKVDMDKAEKESLQQILNILHKEPLADYFWYTQNDFTGFKAVGGGKLIYALPHHDVVPAGSLRVDSDKIKSLLRDIKLDELGL